MILDCPVLSSLVFKKWCGRLSPCLIISSMWSSYKWVVDCDALTQLTFETDSFRKCFSLVISGWFNENNSLIGNKQLNSIRMGRGCFFAMKSFTMRDNKALKQFVFEQTALRPIVCNVDPGLSKNISQKVHSWIKFKTVE